MIRDPDLLTDLLATIRRFVAERLVPLEDEVARTDHIPAEIADEMRRLGLFGMTIPEEYGGLGVTAEEEMLIAFELGRTSPAFRSLIGTNNGIGSQGILIDGTEEQRQSYLPRLASGELVGSFALTEPDAGSDAASLRTSADRDGDHFVLNGTKRYITNAPEADLFTVMARTDPASKGATGITAFLVPADTPGITIGEPERKMGQKGSHVADVVFDRLPGARVVDHRRPCPRGHGLQDRDEGARSRPAPHRRGVRRRRRAAHRRCARVRHGPHPVRQAHRPASSSSRRCSPTAGPRPTPPAAWCSTPPGDVTTARRSPWWRRRSKLFASEMVGRVADRAVQIHGGAGYIADYAVERFYRDVRLFRLYEGTSQIQQIIIAREMTSGATV